MAIRSKRLRKKLYLDEFAVFGFGVSALSAYQGVQPYNQFIDEFLEYIESRGLLFGGGGRPESFEGFVVSNQRYGSPTDDDRKAIQAWLQQYFTNLRVCKLVDANYGDFDKL